MDFNLQAISLADGVAVGAGIPVHEMLGRKIEFRAGITIPVILPASLQDFMTLPEPEKLLPVLTSWARVYRFPQADADLLHVLAPAETEGDEFEYRRIELLQPRSRSGPRPSAIIVGGAVMNRDECATWLIGLADSFAANPQNKQQQVILARPRLPKPDQMRLAWIGPEIVAGKAMKPRLAAIGRVLGAEIISVPPKNYRDVHARLADGGPIDAAVICERYAPYIGPEAIPATVNRDLIHMCGSVTQNDLEDQVRTWIEISVGVLASKAEANPADEEDLLLAIMLRGMLSHTKIGPFNHCGKTTVLTGVRARRLHVARAEVILDRNAESYQEKRDSDCLFLFKEHNDGAQYFLNARLVEDARKIVARMIR